jgi:hypothetical protein
VAQASQAAEKTKNSVILSEAKNLSSFLFLYLNRREILRFAQNDGTWPFFRSLFRLWGFVLAAKRQPGNANLPIGVAQFANREIGVPGGIARQN